MGAPLQHRQQPKVLLRSGVRPQPASAPEPRLRRVTSHARPTALRAPAPQRTRHGLGLGGAADHVGVGGNRRLHCGRRQEGTGRVCTDTLGTALCTQQCVHHAEAPRGERAAGSTRRQAGRRPRPRTLGVDEVDDLIALEDVDLLNAGDGVHAQALERALQALVVRGSGLVHRLLLPVQRRRAARCGVACGARGALEDGRKGARRRGWALKGAACAVTCAGRARRRGRATAARRASTWRVGRAPRCQKSCFVGVARAAEGPWAAPDRAFRPHLRMVPLPPVRTAEAIFASFSRSMAARRLLLLLRRPSLGPAAKCGLR